MKAAKKGDKKTVVHLLNRGDEIEVKNKDSDTALTRAASQGQTETVKLLLEKQKPVMYRSMQKSENECIDILTERTAGEVKYNIWNGLLRLELSRSCVGGDGDYSYGYKYSVSGASRKKEFQKSFHVDTYEKNGHDNCPFIILIDPSDICHIDCIIHSSYDLTKYTTVDFGETWKYHGWHVPDSINYSLREFKADLAILGKSGTMIGKEKMTIHNHKGAVPLELALRIIDNTFHSTTQHKAILTKNGQQLLSVKFATPEDDPARQQPLGIITNQDNPNSIEVIGLSSKYRFKITSNDGGNTWEYRPVGYGIHTYDDEELEKDLRKVNGRDIKKLINREIDENTNMVLLGIINQHFESQVAGKTL